MFRFSRAILPLLLVAAAASGCREVNSSEQQVTVYQILQQSTSHGTFLGALSTTQSASLLQGSEQITVFAPTDQAFQAIPEATRQALFADPDKLRAVVRYHLVQGLQSSRDLTNGRSFTTLQGATVSITRGNGAFRVNQADIVLDNLGGVNGVVHVIDSVLIPPGVL